MKLWEGNVFTGVSLSFCSREEGSHVTITQDALDLTEHPPPLEETSLQIWGLTVQRSSLLVDIWWPSLETCSNLFTSGAPPPPPFPPPPHYCSTWGQCKWVVCILLECFLVITSSSGSLISMAIVMLTRAILF